MHLTGLQRFVSPDVMEVCRCIMSRSPPLQLPWIATASTATFPAEYVSSTGVDLAEKVNPKGSDQDAVDVESVPPVFQLQVRTVPLKVLFRLFL